MRRTIPNPEKFKFTKIKYKQHRIIIPVYIPESDELYFSKLFDVFKLSINSLLSTTNKEQTVITIINNNCKSEVTLFIDELFNEKKIDKHIKLVENLGKVYTIISELNASFEPFITIADADVFYLNNWDKQVFTLFNTFKNVGVVSPVPSPSLYNYHNTSFLIKKYFKIKIGNVVSKRSFEFFKESINNNPNYFIREKIDFTKEQYYIEKQNTKACIGAMHFVATYRREALKGIQFKKPIFVFKSGDEGLYIDSKIDEKGFGRISTLDSFAYHLGHDIPKWTTSYIFKKSIFSINNKNNRSLSQSKIAFFFKRLLYKILRELKIFPIL